MNFPFDAEKATEAAYRFASLEGGSINILKLVKLIYLLDRASIRQRGVPIVGGAYFSMKNGPVTGEILDLINAGELAGVESTWSEHFSDRQNHEISAVKELPEGFLSAAEVKLLQEVYLQHRDKDQWELRDWCHRHCAEWSPLNSGRTAITPASIAEALGKSDEQIRRLVQEANEHAFLNVIL